MKLYIEHSKQHQPVFLTMRGTAKSLGRDGTAVCSEGRWGRWGTVLDLVLIRRTEVVCISFFLSL